MEKWIKRNYTVMCERQTAEREPHQNLVSDLRLKLISRLLAADFLVQLLCFQPWSCLSVVLSGPAKGDLQIPHYLFIFKASHSLQAMSQARRSFMNNLRHLGLFAKITNPYHHLFAFLGMVHSLIFDLWAVPLTYKTSFSVGKSGSSPSDKSHPCILIYPFPF